MSYKDIIQTALNAQLNGEMYMGRPISFYVHTNQGDYEAALKSTQRKKGDWLINAVLLDDGTTPIALQGLNAFERRQTLEIAVPVDLTATDYTTGIFTDGIQYAMGAIEGFTRALNGSLDEMTIDGVAYSYVLGISKPYVGTEEWNAGIGKCIAVSVDLTWQMFDGVIGNEIVVKLSVHNENDYTTALLIDGAAVRMRTGDTNQYEDDKDMRTSITQQSLTVKVIIPYKRTGVAKRLVQDLWNGAVDTTYDLIYYDGVAFDEDHPYTGVFTTKEINEPLSAGSALSITVTFELAHIED